MRLYIISIALFVSLFAAGQKTSFDEGYVITSTGDSLNGLVHWKKDPLPADSLTFKRGETEPVKSFAWTDIREAYNSRNKRYVKVQSVLRNYEYIDDRDYMIKNKDSVGYQEIPLTLVYRGSKLSLYQFYENSPFYFIYDGKQMRQLVQRYRYTNMKERMFDYEKGRRFHITDEYRGLLATYYNFAEDSKMMYILNTTLYEQGSLQTIISKMDKKLR